MSPKYTLIPPTGRERTVPMYEYRVISRKYRTLIGGRFDHTDLEALLNEMGMDGWSLDRILDPETTRLLEDEREVHLFVFRRRRAD